MGDLRKTYFKDGRDFDLAGLRAALAEKYEFLEGMPDLLADLRAVGHRLHGFANYPEWYIDIEEKLGLESRHGVEWTSVSCDSGASTPEPVAYQNLIRRLDNGRKGWSPLLLVARDARTCQEAERAGITCMH